MATKPIKLTGKVKKVECVKGLDRLILENLNFDSEGLMAIKRCANNEEAVEITMKVLQEDLPGTN
ncbi:MAG TPA: hypothetical protein VMW91_10030 [Desulfosporosinus sp.]|nr:hypothetical protein [Desulfosporosinus sp.]